MYPNLPPLNALRSFESAARNVSFTRAASELFVTHGAISKQVKILEEHLGITLFLRQHCKLLLTDEARLYLPHVQTALQTISNATLALQSQPLRLQSLSVNVLPSLTISLLIPRLGDFKSRYPNLYVDLSSSDLPVDFSKCEYDVVIRSATSHPQGVNAIKLMDEDLCLVCSPRVAEQMQSLDDINKMTLLKHTLRPKLWQAWAKEVNVQITTDKKYGMAHFSMLLQAAVNDMGVALIPRTFIEKQLADGSLVIPFSAPFISPYCYYLLMPNSTNQSFKVQAFIDWILEIFAPYRNYPQLMAKAVV
ncbi:transcriptional regulator GcvA [Psychromonas antarctica]|uniref:transcriptional regulator GcvA n=1 Tax=Psychromonas antarctica TaxID=67573 RepID=UPI001EE7C09C|nr:transcriptional regulator GcvA [Psychromonas antarctica]MCG6200828.1 transcriptional regulator GcvA [Psychromonas antarctica]